MQKVLAWGCLINLGRRCGIGFGPTVAAPSHVVGALRDPDCPAQIFLGHLADSTDQEALVHNLARGVAVHKD